MAVMSHRVGLVRAARVLARVLPPAAHATSPRLPIEGARMGGRLVAAHA
jgi:hypothetical protein